MKNGVAENGLTRAFAANSVWPVRRGNGQRGSHLGVGTRRCLVRAKYYTLVIRQSRMTDRYPRIEPQFATGLERPDAIPLQERVEYRKARNKA